jgi:hypothetical protein
MQGIKLAFVLALIAIVSSLPVSRVSGVGMENEEPQTPSSLPLPSPTTTLEPVTETKDKQGNTVLSSGDKDVKVATAVEKELSQEEKDYNKGLVEGVLGAFRVGQNLAKDKSVTTLTQEAIDKKVSGIVATATMGKSDAFKLGLLRGIGMGSDFVTTFGVSGIEKEK